MPEDEKPGATLDLGYPLALAWDLWCAWKDHHVMPSAGGYLNQPRRWQSLIHLMNRRYNVQFDLAKADHDPENRDGGGRGQEVDALDDYYSGAAFGGMDSGRGEHASWERFRGGNE